MPTFNLQPRLTRLLLLALALIILAACGQSEDQAPTDRLALRVDENGIYSLDARALSSFGWDLASIEADQVQLTRGDQPIPFQLTGKGKDRQLRFYGFVEPTRYADYGIYYLTLADDGGATLAERPVSAGAAAPTRQAQDTLHFEENSTYLTQAAGDDPWLGQRLFAPDELTIPLTIDNPTSEAAELVLQFWSASEAPVDPDHHLVYTLNGQVVGEDRWDGKEWRQSQVEIPAGLLQEGENTLVISSPGDTESSIELVYLDWIDLTYERLLKAREDSLAFESDQTSFTVSGFSQGDLEVWDVTEPGEPIRLVGFDVQAGDNNHTLSFSDSAGGSRRYQASAATAFLTPATITPAPELLAMPEGGADYIVIAHPDLVEAVQPLAEYRQAQGLRTAVVTTDQIYQRFSGGLPTPEALTEFMKWAVDTWPDPAPRFVLLAGDASYDPLGYLSGPYLDLVPTSMQATLELGETASDNALADLNGDGWPDLAIGRFPAQTPEEMQAMVEKTLAYEQNPPDGDWRQQMLFVADDDDAYFSRFNVDMVATLPDAFQAEQLVISPDRDVRSELLAAFNEGRRLISYMGHGAVNIWAREEILKTEDIGDLEQQGRLPFVIVWACLNGYFQHPKTQSLGETLLLTPDKGAVAALVPTGLTFPNDQYVMAEALFGRHLFTEPTIGEALLASFQELDPERPGQRDIIHTFVLLGDPALRLFSPPADEY